MFWLEGHEFLTGRQYVICGDASNQAEGMHSGMAMAEGWWSSSPFCWPEVHLPLLHWHREWCAFGMLKQCCLIDIEMIFSFAPGCSCFSVSWWCIYIYIGEFWSVQLKGLTFAFFYWTVWLTVPGQIQSGQANHRWQRLQHEGSISCCLVTGPRYVEAENDPRGKERLLYNTVVILSLWASMSI